MKLYAWWRLPSPGSAMRFHTRQTTQPFSSSIMYHSIGKCGMVSPGKVLMAEVIHFRIASRPPTVP